MSASTPSAGPQRLRLGLARATGYPVTLVGLVVVLVAGLATLLTG